MKLYIYIQNNSGGSFAPPAVTVIVEAVSHKVADALATEFCEIYFDGVALARDCKCCGDRWSEADDYCTWVSWSMSVAFLPHGTTELIMLTDDKGNVLNQELYDAVRARLPESE